ncbi:hypothetical protein COLO4_28766 [Corchorus olitorius]|uniref:No apical meristem (NAM) protein n=1 Tax=Corchorus olitorius TaxID=93759 RepID=A0A1R3HIB3_9ROSI|nr:hypothetical protein COLO4_28766 [Corchorus olitorius]
MLKKSGSRIDRVAGCGCWLNQSFKKIKNSGGKLLGFDKSFTFTYKGLSEYVICEIKNKDAVDKKRKGGHADIDDDDDGGMPITKKPQQGDGLMVQPEFNTLNDINEAMNSANACDWKEFSSELEDLSSVPDTYMVCAAEECNNSTTGSSSFPTTSYAVNSGGYGEPYYGQENQMNHNEENNHNFGGFGHQGTNNSLMNITQNRINSCCPQANPDATILFSPQSCQWRSPNMKSAILNLSSSGPVKKAIGKGFGHQGTNNPLMNITQSRINSCCPQANPDATILFSPQVDGHEAFDQPFNNGSVCLALNDINEAMNLKEASANACDWKDFSSELEDLLSVPATDMVCATGDECNTSTTGSTSFPTTTYAVNSGGYNGEPYCGQENQMNYYNEENNDHNFGGFGHQENNNPLIKSCCPQGDGDATIEAFGELEFTTNGSVSFTVNDNNEGINLEASADACDWNNFFYELEDFSDLEELLNECT